MKIALIPPQNKSDYLANTVIDGILCLIKDGSDIEMKMPNYPYPCPYDLGVYVIDESSFLDFAKSANLIILCWGKNSTNFELANKIDEWKKTVFIDGSELGKNNRFDQKIEKEVLEMTYVGNGVINKEMLDKCALYFRREKPYIKGIIPLPFGIESRYLAKYDPDQVKDIDFSCVFGQEDYPILRKYSREYLEIFCKKNGFECYTKKTKGFNFDDNKKLAGRDQFYDVLARTKVGISIGGGGFDTARFWETLGNNCLLLSEKINIYEDGGNELNYERIFQFSNLDEYKIALDKLAAYLRHEYNQTKMVEEYEKILREHSTKARFVSVLENAQKAGIKGLGSNNVQ